MKFIRIGEDTIRLDMIVRIKEGKVDETLYGRSVRKTSDRVGWIEVYFVVGEPLKFVGPAADIVRNLLEEEYGVRDLTQKADDWQRSPGSEAPAPLHAIPPPSAFRSSF